MLSALGARVRDTLVHFPRALRLVWRSSPGQTALLTALTLASAALPPAVAWVGKLIVDAVVARDRERTLRWVAAELLLVLALAGVQRGVNLLRQLLGARLSLDVNVLILEKALTLELRHFEDPEFYDQLTRARREASSRPLAMVTDALQLVQHLLTLAGYVALLVQFSPLAVVGLVLAAFPATLAEMRFSQVAFRIRNWRSPEARKLNYLEYVLANDDHAKEVKVYGLGPMLLGRYKALGESFYEEDKALTLRRAGWAHALSLLGTGAFYGCYVLMALSAVDGQLSLGDMTLYVVAFRSGQQAFQSILASVGGMYEHGLYLSNLFAYLAIPTNGHARPQASPGVSAASPFGAAPPPQRPFRPDPPGIRFENVGFRYPGREEWALRGLDLFVPRGQALALVGHNGAGKTTLIKLLARLYEPTEGRIVLDGKDLAAWDPDALRARIGVVFQDFNQYHLTLRENVGVGSVGNMEDDERIRRAIRKGGADELLAQVPGGMDAMLGRWFKSGVELSGGQWQKVALARAFMREEADILVLDEPTASLDAEAEALVFQRFRELAAGRTTIVISHRFPTVRMADRIVVLEQGRATESGTHDELVRKGGTYARLFQLQARGYQ